MFQYAVYGNTSWVGTNFSMTDVNYAKKTLPKLLNTWTGDLSAFKKRGGKLIHLHGTQDTVRRDALRNALPASIADGTFFRSFPLAFHRFNTR